MEVSNVDSITQQYPDILRGEELLARIKRDREQRKREAREEQRRKSIEAFPQRMLAKRLHGAKTKCWEWTGARNRGNYGLYFDPEGKQRLAHRYFYELEKGPIPEGALIRHKCDNPPCCNPHHLLPGTNADNSSDIAKRGRNNWQAQLAKQEQIKKEMRLLYCGGIAPERISVIYRIPVLRITRLVFEGGWCVSDNSA